MKVKCGMCGQRMIVSGIEWRSLPKGRRIADVCCISCSAYTRLAERLSEDGRSYVTDHGDGPILSDSFLSKRKIRSSDDMDGLPERGTVEHPDSWFRKKVKSKAVSKKDDPKDISRFF